MNLINYDNIGGKSCLFINNIKFEDLLPFFLTESIVVERVYAYDDTSVYDESFLKTVKDNKEFILKLNTPSIFLNSLTFIAGESRIEINDGYEYVIYSDEVMLRRIASTLLGCPQDLFTKLENYQGKYILIVDCKVVSIFNDFDEFLQSGVDL